MISDKQRELTGIFKKALCVVVPLMLGLSACGQVSGDGDDNQYREAMQKHQKEISLACAMAMTNILHELQGLVQQYLPLSDVGEASIESYDKSPYSYFLQYSKNSHFEKNPNNLGVASLGSDVLGKGGAKLTIFFYNVDDLPGPLFLFNGPAGVAASVEYPLILEGQKGKILLHYFLSLNSTDPALEKAVRDIIEKQVDILRKSFQNILGYDPAMEKTKACAPVITNILNGLQELAKQFPALSDIGSATIENKGTNYVYQHLHYWKNAHVATTNDALPYQGLPAMDIPFVEKGGIALDVYIRNADEPFGFSPDNTYTLVSADGKTQLDYSMYFNFRDKSYDSKELVKATDKAIRDVIENQRNLLREKLKDIIDF